MLVTFDLHNYFGLTDIVSSSESLPLLIFPWSLPSYREKGLERPHSHLHILCVVGVRLVIFTIYGKPRISRNTVALKLPRVHSRKYIPESLTEASWRRSQRHFGHVRRTAAVSGIRKQLQGNDNLI